MSEQSAETPPEGGEQAEEQEAKTFDAEYVDKLRKEAAKYRTEAKANADAAKRLAEIEESSKTAEQKAAEREAAAIRRAEEAELRVMRRDIAIEFELSKDDADLLDDLTSEDAMRRHAERHAAKREERKKHGNHVPREGNNPKPGGEDEMRGFTRDLFARATAD